MKRILVATTNQGKLAEYKSLLSDFQLELVSPDDMGITIDVIEDGNTFEENAVIKAKAFAKESGLLTLADDSGLEVDALGGRPGVHTARYGGDGLTPKERWQLLLENMQGIPAEERTARFRCVVALSTPNGEIQTSDGVCEGVITTTPAGLGGFGYDPIFYLPSHACTMAELPMELKNRISHRAVAVKGIRPALEALRLS